MFKATISILVFILFTSFAQFSYSWESDMHYGLTKWLAFKAGFNLDDAEIIAAGAESADRSNALKASFIVPMNICIGKSAEASRHVQQHHFPSDGYVRFSSDKKYPHSPRDKRIVIPGHENKQNSGNRWVRQEIEVAGISGHNEIRRTNLNRFGQSLHPLGDSWSHQGEPDMIKMLPPCPEDLVWSHSEKRGGWSSHDADLTYKFVEDSVRTAKATYYFMKKYLENNKDYRYLPEPKPWKNLEQHVIDFAKKKTAPGKKSWFDSNHDVPLKTYETYPCFLRDTNLEGHNKICEEKFRQVAGPTARENININEISGYFEVFLSNWIVNGGIDYLFSYSFRENVNIAEIRNMLIKDKIGSLRITEEEWVRILFAMWLVRDHGIVNALGHGMPYKEGFDALPSICYKLGEKFESLSAAIHFPGTSRPFIIQSLPQSDNGAQRFAAFFQFRHVPRDMVTLVAEREGISWKISGLGWIIN